MSITGIETATAAATSKSAASGQKLAESFDTFLVMLTTQLKHQDPLSPMDSTEFTNQLVQFANVEQQINANSNLETLIGMNQINQNSWAISYIGRTIEAASSQVPLQGSAETVSDKLVYNGSNATFSYTLPSTAASVKITIQDANGNTVRTLTGAKSAGRHEMSWDGSNAEGGTADNGTYTVKVEALDSAGNALSAPTKVVTESGKAFFSYTLAEDARSVAIVIKDAAGKIVRNLPAQGGKGRHEMDWDGKDTNGKLLPDGAYGIEVVATSAEGETVESATTVYGRVTDVSADDKETLLNMGGVVTTLSNVLTVRETAASAN